MKKIRVYIAFSITGTSAFITATKEVSKHQYDTMVNGGGFIPVTSRRPNYQPEDGIKLGWIVLNTLSGKPLRSPALVLNRFNQLTNDGWSVNKDKFVRRHYRERRVNSNHHAV